MQPHVDRRAVFVFPLRFDGDSLDDGCFPIDLALEFQPAVLIDSSNKNISQERRKFAFSRKVGFEESR